MRCFNYEKRKLLEEYLQKKVTITRISKGMNISRQTIYNEMKLGLSEKDFIAGNYTNYSAEQAQKNIQNMVLRKVR